MGPSIESGIAIVTCRPRELGSGCCLLCKYAYGLLLSTRGSAVAGYMAARVGEGH